MNSKDIFRDLILICGSLLLNLLVVFLALKLINNINTLLLGFLYEKSSLDELLMNIHTFSIIFIFIISFGYFVYLDLKTIFLFRGNANYKNKSEEVQVVGKKEYINKAYNLYGKTPIEYPLYQIIKIYLRRLCLAFLVILPFYILAVVIYLFLMAPTMVSVVFFIFLFGAAFIYLHDSKLGKKFEISLKNFINSCKPDKIGGTDNSSNSN